MTVVVKNRAREKRSLITRLQINYKFTIRLGKKKRTTTRLTKRHRISSNRNLMINCHAVNIMTAVHSPFGLLDSMSLTSNETDHTNATFNSLRTSATTHNQDVSFVLPQPLPLPDFVFPARNAPEKSLSFPRWSSSQTRSPSGLDLDEKKLARNFVLECPSSVSPKAKSKSEPVSPCTVPPQSSFQDKDATGTMCDEKNSGVLYSTPPFKIGDPSLAPLSNMPPGRSRGHAHRRSAAISNGDLKIILKPNYSLRVGNSLPNSPKPDLFSQSLSRKPTSNNSVETEANDASLGDPGSSIKVLRSTRVEFSDDIQIIPRPLSMSSCDAASTIRSGHSMSNSLSSIVSSVANPPVLKLNSSKHSLVDRRPHTAEPASEREGLMLGHAPKRSESLPHLTAKKSMSSSDLFKFPVFQIPEFRTPCHAANLNENNFHTSDYTDAQNSTLSRKKCPSRRSSLGSKTTKKPKKVKSWAGSILSRKTRQRSQKHHKFKTPQAPHLVSNKINEAVDSHISESFTISCYQREDENDYAKWEPRKLYLPEEPVSPVIDLDAALGPFNTPSSNLEVLKDGFRRGSNRKKAMHSAAGLGGFSGPGMHYHRRAESAPEFENPRFGLHRLGSSSTMAMEDVFEEDEDELRDDANLSEKQVNLNASEAGPEKDSDPHSSVRVSPSENEKEMSGQLELQISGSRLEEPRIMNPKFSQSSTSLSGSSEKKLSEAANDTSDESIRQDSAAELSTSTYQIEFRQEICPIEIPAVPFRKSYPSPTLTSSHSAATPSPFPSPLSPLSPLSYDTLFISTAPSSTTDDHGFESLLLGEPGPELRMSVDDLSSLTRSDSTTTRESFNPNSFQSRFKDGQRSASFSTTVANRKRSSIASLSRLISSAHGERSKLAIESRAPSYCEGDSRQKSISRTKRISRLMKFWKKSDDPA